MLVDICGFSTQSLTKRAMVYQTVCLSMILILRLHEKSINFNILKDLSFFLSFLNYYSLSEQLLVLIEGFGHKLQFVADDRF